MAVMVAMAAMVSIVVMVSMVVMVANVVIKMVAIKVAMMVARGFCRFHLHL